MTDSFNWNRICQIVGLALIAAHVLFSDHPDAGIIVALMGLAGLPSFVELDRKRREDKEKK